MASLSLPRMSGWGNFLALWGALGLSPLYGERLGALFFYGGSSEANPAMTSLPPVCT
jgi:hypothetical protein